MLQEPEAWEILADLEKIADEYQVRCGHAANLCRELWGLGGSEQHGGNQAYAHLEINLGLRRLLCEVHEEYATNIALALRGFWVRSVLFL